MDKKQLEILTNIIGGVESGGRYMDNVDTKHTPEREQTQRMKKHARWVGHRIMAMRPENSAR